MDFNEFALNRKNCYVAGNGFLFWKISYDDNVEAVKISGDGSNVIVHIVVLRGEMAVSYGGKEYVIPKNSIVTFLEHSSLELHSVSDNICAYLIVLKDAYAMELMKYNPPFPISYVMKIRKNPVETMKSEAIRKFTYKLDYMENACADDKHIFRSEMIRCSLWIFLMDIANEHIRQEEQDKGTVQPERKKELFMRYMQLLTVHVADEHSVGFYASKLCVTRQYLNRVVKLSSYKTAYEWICFTLMGEIMKYLESTNASMQQVSEHFKFSDQASFAKFFKRQTGYSPTEYKKRLIDK